jgi:hypothetical protein
MPNMAKNNYIKILLEDIVYMKSQMAMVLD